MLTAIPEADVKIYYNGSQKFTTTGSGVDITDTLNVAGVATFGSANVVAAGGTFQVGSGGTVFYADTSGVVTIGTASTAASITINGGSVPSIGLVIALGG